MNSTEEPHFAFGKNWQMFLKTLNEEKIAFAKKTFCDFVGLTSLEGKTFLDIGSGSGLFSYAALLLGAKQVASFDYDEFSVHCTNHLRDKAGSPNHWKVMQGSVLDQTFMSGLGKFDVVYSWGVLHHTGDMWTAINHAVAAVAPGGLLYIAIYNDMPSSAWWVKIKWLYNHSPRLIRWLMEVAFMAVLLLANLIVLRKNPITVIKKYQSNRGMSWRRDMTDWVGGYPYEYAGVGEIFQYMKQHFPNFSLVNVKSVNNLGCNEFLFQDIQAS